MDLTLLKIHNLRNIQNAELETSSGINVLWGGNGSGKTTVMEAIYMLGRGRSFRGQQLSPLLKKGTESFSVFGKLKQASGMVSAIGLEKNKEGIKARVDQEEVRRLSILARVMPVQIITPKTHEIFERGPGYRRRFLDWGVFHVEHIFYEMSARYQRALRQRNAALRQSPKTAFAWDKELVVAGEGIDRLRRDYIESLRQQLDKVLPGFLGDRQITLSYRGGWSAERGLQQQLEQTRVDDLRRGYTGAGPHRADLLIEMENLPVEKTASRGEQKLLIAALYIAQAALAGIRNKEKPILLIDDLPAELDKKNRGVFLGMLSSLGNQAFVSGTDLDFFTDISKKAVFHVEHGEISKQCG